MPLMGPTRMASTTTIGISFVNAQPYASCISV
jgi:hypothetical protein